MRERSGSMGAEIFLHILEKQKNFKHMKAINVLLADDHNLVRDGIRSTLETQSNIKVVGEASDGLEAIEKCKSLKPDIAILDITMPEMSGLEAAVTISEDCPNTKILILSMHDKEDYIKEAIEVGAAGYLLKDANKEEFVKAVNAVAEGEKYFSSSVSNVLASVYLSSLQGGPASRSEAVSDNDLTRRERDILKRIVNGNNNRQIAEDLDLSVRTVEAHRFKIMKKLGVKNAAELVKTAFEKNLV